MRWFRRAAPRSQLGKDEVFIGCAFALVVAYLLGEAAGACAPARREVAALGAALACIVAANAIRVHRRHRRAVEARVVELEAFAVRVAHDVRSPLGPALITLQRLDATLPALDPMRPAVVRGLRSLRSIERLVDALFAFASAGAAPPRRASASVREAAEAVVADHHDAAAERGIRLLVECPAGMRVACSEGVLASILGNLVGNAVKYVVASDQRRVEVRAREHGEQLVRIEVQDSGPGLPRDCSARVFEPYFRADPRQPGLGLGLATVKRLAMAHGGTVGVAPARPHGCVFWVELPAMV